MENAFGLARIPGRAFTSRLFVAAPGPVGSGSGVSPLLRLARTAVLLILFVTSFLALSSSASADECPNEQFRKEQFVTETLGECRAYEKVSPADKGLGDIVGDGMTTIAAQAGDAVAFSTRTPFGDTVGSGTVGQTQYVARRTDDAWAVNAITPTGRPDARQTFFTSTLLKLYSNDLRTVVVRAYDLPGATDDAPLRNNIYVEDTATRALETVSKSQVETPTIFDFLVYPDVFWGLSADARHIAFVTETQFLPDAVPVVPNVYKWANGVLSVASILPDGTAAANGADSPANLRGAMSADGSRLLFTASTGGNPQLFMQIDGRKTAWVSETELDPSDPNYQPDPSVQAVGMTPDGRSVFFTSSAPLVPGDTGGGLYRYTDSPNPSSDKNLTRISQGDFNQFIGMSDDGDRVYYHTSGAEVLVWDNGTTRLVSSGVPLEGVGLDLTAAPGNARVTPDGMFLALVSDGILPAKVTNNHNEMYLYSLKDNTLTCTSCPSAPATSDVTVLPASTHGEPTVGSNAFRPRYLSDSGKVFFSTAEALVPRDTNRVFDAYEYDPTTGELSLLSSGTGKDPSTFADASASGDNVFFVTRQRLVESDRDELVDLYDARTDGGFREEQGVTGSSPCQDDGCQGFPGPAPESQTLASVTLTGPGNLNTAASKKQTTRGLTRAQRLRRALKACKGKPKAKKKKCESDARRRFGKSGGSK